MASDPVTSTTTSALIRHSDLRRRDWTPTMITRFLGAPVEQARNPHCPHAQPMRLYAAAEAHEVERSAGFGEYLEKIAQARHVAQVRAAANRHALLSDIARTPIRVYPMSAQALTLPAIQHYVALQAEPYDDPQGLVDELPAEGITPWLECTFLRHTRVDVSDLIELAYRRTGRRWAELLATTRLFAAIAEHWPHLAAEADRQWWRWWAQYRSRTRLGSPRSTVLEVLASLSASPDPRSCP